MSLHALWLFRSNLLRHDRSPYIGSDQGKNKARPLSGCGLGAVLTVTFALRENLRKGQVLQVMWLVCLGVYLDVQMKITLAVMADATIVP